MVTRIVDRYGTAVIFKNNKPRYEVRMIEDTEEAETASDEEVLSVIEIIVFVSIIIRTPPCSYYTILLG